MRRVGKKAERDGSRQQQSEYAARMVAQHADHSAPATRHASEEGPPRNKSEGRHRGGVVLDALGDSPQSVRKTQDYGVLVGRVPVDWRRNMKNDDVVTEVVRRDQRII